MAEKYQSVGMFVNTDSCGSRHATFAPALIDPEGVNDAAVLPPWTGRFSHALVVRDGTTNLAG